MGGVQRGPQIGVGGVAFRELEILADGAVEEERLLRDIGEVLAQRGLRERGNVDAVDGDLPGSGFVKAG